MVPALEAPEVIVICGVEYFLDWRRLTPGSSFFIPTVASVKQVRQILKEAYVNLPYTFIAYQRREYGRYGVRVWRID
jgi:hypothetical protein